jgi:UBA/TS-N domain
MLRVHFEVSAGEGKGQTLTTSRTRRKVTGQTITTMTSRFEFANNAQRDHFFGTCAVLPLILNRNKDSRSAMNRQQHPQQRAPQPQASRLQGSDWFAGAPASQVLLTFGVALYLVIHDASTIWQFDSEALIGSTTGTRSIYRSITSKGTFLSTGELVVGTALQFYLYRRYERELGTRKFVAFWLFVHVACIAQEWFILQLIMSRNRVMDVSQPLRWQYAGPYAFLGSLFAIFHCYAPRIHPRFVSALGFHFSEKSLYYLWFLYLTGSGSWHALLSAGTGAISTVVYLKILRSNLDVPDVVVQTVQPFFERLGVLGTTTMIRAAVAPHAAAPNAQAPRPPQPTAPVEQPVEQFLPMPEPDASAVEQLTAMGFPQREVMEALRQSHNNVEHAANRLLSGS